MDKIILVGGSPTTGKSYTAKKIAETLKIPWISTDLIRNQMRRIVRKKDYPKLFFFSEEKEDMAAKYLSKTSAKDIVKHQNQESVEVWKGVKAIIDGDYVWGSFIIEGVAILPKLVHKLVVKNKKITPVFLVDDNFERVRKTIFTRGLWGPADEYPDNVKEKEVEWVLEFNDYILKEAKKYNLPVVNIGDRIKYIEEVKRIVK